MKYQLMPELSKADYNRLKADIKANGVICPIIYDTDGNVLDGYNRLKICGELGIVDFPSVVQNGLKTEQEKRSFARRININRRHLTTKQKQAVIREEILETEGMKNDSQIATDLGVAKKTVKRQRQDLIESGDVGNFPTSIDTMGRQQPTTKPKKEEPPEPEVETEPESEPPPSLEMIVDRVEEPQPAEIPKSTKTFNLQKNDNIEWAKWTWNPFIGCEHNCPYCYAKDIAVRFYGNFDPQWFEDRLAAPFNTKIPAAMIDEPGINNVFLGSMTDFFGDFIPEEWILKTLAVVEKTPKWNYLILTKNPKRILDFLPLPSNVWIGTTIDTQDRVWQAVNTFNRILEKAPETITFASCEPLKENLTIGLQMFKWIIIGGQSKNSKQEASQPEWAWVEHLLNQARLAKCKVYFKPNLTIRPQEYPERSA